MISDGVEGIKKIREKEDEMSREIDAKKQECEATIKKEKDIAEKNLKELESNLQVKYELAIKEKEVESGRKIEATIESAKEQAEKMISKVKDEDIIGELLKVMDEYVSE
jgi:vacuolar-type H+-ATPase subunit H